ncbi:MAG: thiazole synthase [Planctomycetota bacterium]|jgi:thiazole synthase|nr:thiazole synthase [Planctomycetota bacterium]MDP6521001.1 thiazole synthase [Planctomycetota bacterium]MDP6838602.1 thiazole synthase [Planctomycetota bacterium]
MSDTSMKDSPLILGDVTLSSRLLVGTGKYADNEEMVAALEASGTDCVTVAVRRVDLGAGEGPNLLGAIDRERYCVLPNTAGCFDAESAVRTARLARDVLETNLVKLEVLGDTRTLLPDPLGTLKAAEQLVKDGFNVLVYTSDDPRLAVHLQEVGVTSVMPAGSPIGSGQGILNPNALAILMELVEVPVIIDAGVGTASDVAIAMELGAAGVLLNSGIALAREPVRMARAMGAACRAGRDAFLAGRIEKKLYANASSPLEGTIAGAAAGELVAGV